jgi:hypothetical protein
LGDLSVDGRGILKFIIKGIGCESVNLIQMAEDTVQRWAFVNIVTNLHILQKSEIS